MEDVRSGEKERQAHNSYESDGSSASPDALDEELLEPLLPDASASASSDWREMTPTGKQSLHL